VEFTINGTLPSGAQGGLRVKIGCGGGTDCYQFANTWPRIGAGGSFDPNTTYEIPTTAIWAWKDNDDGEPTIALPFLVMTKDDNCKKAGLPRHIEVSFQVYQTGVGSDDKSIRITIRDDDRDGTDLLGLITFLKPECGATFGG